MRTKFRVVLSMFVIVTFCIMLLGSNKKIADNGKSDWTLSWSDEFNGTSVDTTKWDYDIGNAIVDKDGNKVTEGWGNNELEYYTKSTKNVGVKDGKLSVTALKETSPAQFGKTFNYTSGKIKTLGKFSMKYGKLDIKAKLPIGKGLWPAIWMLPVKDAYGGWAASGELDIAEGWGSKPQTVAGTIHYGATWPNNKYTGKEFNFPTTTSVNEFHNYGLEWEPGEIRWYIDGVLYQTQNNWSTKGVDNEQKYSFPAPYDQDFYLILNLAVGGNFDGDPIAETKFPTAMEVDYVRAYKLTGREYKTPVEPKVTMEPLPTGAKVATADGNLLSNSNFTEPIQDNPEAALDFSDKWNFVHVSQFAGNGTQSIDTIDGKKYAKISVTNAGSQNVSVQLIQLTTLGKGRYYKVSFDAKAATTRKIGMKMSGGAEAGWGVYSDIYDFALTDKFQHFEKVFQMAGASNIKSRLEFNLGSDTNAVWIGNARVEEVNAPIQNFDASKTPFSDGNHIYNGTFDKESIDRMAYWNFNVATGAEATAIVPEATRELFVKVSKGGKEASAITLNQKGIQLEQNTDYKLTFKARAKSAKTIKVGFLSKDGTVSYNEDKTINLTKSMEEKTISFKMNKPTDSEAQIIFKLGGDNNDVYMDDVTLTSSINYSLVDIYPLKNGDFSKGLESWTPYPNIGDGAASTITAVNGAAKISLTAPGPNPYSVMLNQENFKVTKGVQYKIAFDVSATAERSIGIVIDNAAYYQYLTKNVKATSGVTHYEFTLIQAKDDTVSLKFLLGNVDATVPTKAHDIVIDNVVCEVKDAPFKRSPTLTKSETDNKLTKPINITFTDDLAWRNAITSVKINDIAIATNRYTVAAGKITLAADNFATIGNYTIMVVANGYANATCVQDIRANDNLIISNGTFDADTTGWSVYTGDGSNASVASADGKLKVSFPDYAGWNRWSTQVYQDTIKLEAGKKYVLKFDASSTVARDGWVEMNNMEQQVLALTPTTKTFSYEFTAANTISNGKLNILLGTNNLDGTLFAKNQSVNIDNISITEKSIVVDKIISNGTFDADTTGWMTYTADGSNASVASVDGKMKVNFPDYAGWNRWSTQVYQETIKLEAGKKYVLKFDASSTVIREAWVEMSNMDQQVLALTPAAQTFTYEFTAANTISNGKLNFLLGTNNLDGALFTKNQSVSIDNVSITEK
ncbi:MAG: carbohydrate binding domain-containing protein [Clostridiaceae bacterium]|nr:carbohydrate binding domain-containing protein [Clostridiaceae bacterium]